MLLIWRHLLRKKPPFSARMLYSGVSFVPLIQDLKSRGLVAQVTSDTLAQTVEKKPLTVYLGVDPTAASLHAGNLLALMGLLHFQIRGHQVISLIGGATGSIGDPGGRSTERALLSRETLDQNVSKITEQVHRFFDKGARYAISRARSPSNENQNTGFLPPKVMNNLDWLGGVGLLDFLRMVGKYAKVHVMLSRDSVKSRLDSEHGISFTEFSYQLLQAYDFYVLHRDHGCQVQIGGSDQWGNIVAGIDLIRRHGSASVTAPAPNETTIPERRIDGKDEPVFGMTIPLLLTSAGQKFGKSAGNAVWLDSSLTSVFDFYQFFMRVTDADVGSYLRMFTFLPLDDVESIMLEHQKYPDRRSAQRMLASEVTELIHGEDGLKHAEAATSALFGPGLNELNNGKIAADDVIAALGNDPRLALVQDKDRYDIIGESLTKLSAKFKHTRSRSEAKQTILAGGFYLNNDRVTELDRRLNESDLIDGRIAIIRTGKDNHMIIVLP